MTLPCPPCLPCPHWREVEATPLAASAHGDGETAIAIVGAGPVGLTLALDLAQRGVPCTVLDGRRGFPAGSRAICWSRRSLDIFNRFGIAATMRKVGAQWRVGRVYHKADEIYHLHLTPDTFPENPYFVNFQQSLCEYLLVQQAQAHEAIDLRWGNTLIALEQTPQGIALQVQGAAGGYTLRARYVVACDGAKSFVRECLGLSFEGRKFQDRFLIADIELKSDFPLERRFWFEPPFHDGQSTLLHKQAQDIWRVDFQLDSGEQVSAEQVAADKAEENVRRRIRAFLGRDDFTIIWCSVYFFTCRRLRRFRHGSHGNGNIFFAGDSAHVVSPFGARGGNGGIEDANNLGWKLAAVLQRRADEALLDSYEAERIPACDDNLLNSSRTTDFMTPKSAKSKRIRDTVLRLARRHGFAKRLVNSGRMSVPFSYRGIGMFRHAATGAADIRAGDVAADLPLKRGDASSYLLHHLRDYTLIACKRPPLMPTESPPAESPTESPPCAVLNLNNDGGWQADDALLRRYYFRSGGGYALIRPDQYVLGIWEDDSPQAAWEMRRRAAG